MPSWGSHADLVRRFGGTDDVGGKRDGSARITPSRTAEVVTFWDEFIICISICMYIHMYMCVYIYLYIKLCVYATHMWVCISLSTSISMFMCMCMAPYRCYL